MYYYFLFFAVLQKLAISFFICMISVIVLLNNTRDGENVISNLIKKLPVLH